MGLLLAVYVNLCTCDDKRMVDMVRDWDRGIGQWRQGRTLCFIGRQLCRNRIESLG